MHALVAVLIGIGKFILGALAVIAVLVALAVISGLIHAARDEAERKRRRAAGLGSPAKQLLSRIKRLVRPTLLLVPAKESGFSKLGGYPELPAEVGWPAGEKGPRFFVAQIDLAAFQGHVQFDWLPENGRIYAFYDEERHGCADVVRVLYSAQSPGSASEAPPGLARIFPERRVAFMVFSSAPSLEWLNIDPTEVDMDLSDEDGPLAKMADAPPPDELQHRIGGYPNEIQPETMRLVCEHMARGLTLPKYGETAPPAIERSSKQWRLLLQVDSDPGLNMNWGDGGRLYVFIRQKDGQAADFSKTVAIWQTY